MLIIKPKAKCLLVCAKAGETADYNERAVYRLLTMISTCLEGD